MPPEHPPSAPVVDARAGSDRAADLLTAGHVVGLATDTVYGLAARLDRPHAVARLSELKHRPAGVPIAVLVADAAQAATLGRLGPAAAELAAKHWPGALTVVVDGVGGVGEVIGSADGSVGLRCPALASVRDLAGRVGALATTSANRHGESPALTASETARRFPGLALVLDDGEGDGEASTVVDARSDPPVVLRPGPVVLD